MKRPAFQFYPGDWQRDSALRSCSIPARGLWVEMMCVMHQSEPYGYLLVNGRPVDDLQLARMVGASPKEISAWRQELERAGVYSVDDKGIFSRRMVRDERIRAVRIAAGRLGGNPDLLNQKVNQPDNHAHKQTSNQSPTPSSSSSSSTSKTKETSRFALPDWVPKDAWDAWWKSRKGKPTEDAKKLNLRELENLKTQGHDPRAVLEQSTMRGWTGLFPLKDSAVKSKRADGLSL